MRFYRQTETLIAVVVQFSTLAATVTRAARERKKRHSRPLASRTQSESHGVGGTSRQRGLVLSASADMASKDLAFSVM